MTQSNGHVQCHVMPVFATRTYMHNIVLEMLCDSTHTVQTKNTKSTTNTKIVIIIELLLILDVLVATASLQCFPTRIGGKKEENDKYYAKN